MTTMLTSPSAQDGLHAAVCGRVRKTLLLMDGLFLTGMGGAFAIFDLWSYFLGGGPIGQLLYNLPYTVGFFEAHGLAFILGLLLLRARREDPARLWHLVGAGIHLLLGSANLLFWPLAVQWDAEAPEMVVTTIHGLFVVVQLATYLWSRRCAGRAQAQAGD